MGSMHTKPADSPEALAEAMDHLRAGRLVGVPSDTGYGFAASALHLDAVARLHALNGGPLLLALTFPVEVFDWLPYLTGVGVRLARRFWPGPLALAGNQGVREGLLSCLPDNVRRSLAPDGFLPLTVPAQPQLRRLLHGFAAPILLAEATTAAQFAVLAAGAASLVLDAGPAPDEGGRTLLQLDGRRVRLLREGAVGLSEIDDALPCRVLFVCTGNTCRSPIAKALCEKMLADWLGCDAADLPKRGYLVQSAGLAALAGEGPSPEGVEAIRPWGADLSGHRSQPLSYDMLARADFVFAMTRSHLRVLCDLMTDLGPAPRLLAPGGADVADPIGGPPEVYRECARQIRQLLEELLPELQEQCPGTD